MGCLIVGDSIALGVAMYRTECVTFARGGWNSWQWNRDYLAPASALAYKTAIVSLGANDHAGVKSEQELRKMRAGIKADRVYWISPGARQPVPLAAIEKIAAEYGDIVLPRPDPHMSPDNVHPTPFGYRQLGKQAK